MGKAPQSLVDSLGGLTTLGCYPSIYYRGAGIWRAHVNSCGNFWADARCPQEALGEAESLWRKAGKPLDGRADGG